MVTAVLGSLSLLSYLYFFSFPAGSLIMATRLTEVMRYFVLASSSISCSGE